MKPNETDGFKYLPEYGIHVRPDGAVRTKQKGVHFGTTDSRGYQLVGTRRGRRLVHRIVMEAFLGPSNLEVNHKNGLKTDNRLGNLEYCTKVYNRRDSVLRRGARGCRQTSSGRYQAAIVYEGKSVALGTFDTEKEAHAAYVKKRTELWNL